VSENKDGSRSYDAPNADALAEFMKSGWRATPLLGIQPSPAIKYVANRTKTLSAKYPGIRLIIPAGGLKQRSNDTDYRFRAHSDFTYLTGLSTSDTTPDSVLVLEPSNAGHTPILFLHPRSSRESDQFYRNARYGEFWVGRRMTLDETREKYGIATRDIASLEALLSNPVNSLIIRGQNALVDSKVAQSKQALEELATYLYEMRLI